MKGRKLLFIIFMVFLSACLFSCSDAEITALSPKNEVIYLQLNDYIYVDNHVNVEGKGKLFVAVETVDILALDGNKIIGKNRGTGYVTVTGGKASCVLKIEVTDAFLITADVSGGVYDYDGQPKSPTFVGKYPEGTQIIYRRNGEIFQDAVDPGVYEVEMEVIPPDGYRVEYVNRDVSIVINKAFIDLSYIGFSAKEYKYDGTEKRVEIEGELPDGVTVKYTDNAAVDSGVYLAKAEFFANETFYEPIPPRYARLIITKRSFEVDYSGFVNKTFIYDGKAHLPTLNVPDGVSVSLSVFDEKTRDYIPFADYMSGNEAARPFINAGEYRVLATFDLDAELARNYFPIQDEEIVIRISKAQFINELNWKINSDVAVYEYDFIYDGNPISVGVNLTENGTVSLTGNMPTGVNGEFPEGASAEVSVNGKWGSISATDAGVYTAQARFTMPSGDWQVNYEPLSDMSFRFIISKAPYPIEFDFNPTDEEGKDFSAPVTFDGKSHYFRIRFSSEEDRVAFFESIDVKYYYKKSDAEMSAPERIGIFDVGTYTVGCEFSFKSDEKLADLRKNYKKPTEKMFVAEIIPIIFDVSDVVFDTAPDGTAINDVVYDGKPHSVFLKGLPDGVLVHYQNNGVIDAGDYRVVAEMRADGIAEGNYRLMNLKTNSELKKLTTTLIIRKARFPESDIPACTVKGGEYSPDKSLSDYEIEGAPQGTVRWYLPNDVPTCDRTSYAVVYNRDAKNYYDYHFVVSLTVTPIVIDGTELKIDEQFIPFGSKIEPRATLAGKIIGELKIDYKSDAPINQKGDYFLSDISVRLNDEVNYRLIGSPTFDGVTVHIYNGDIYRYDELNSELLQYTGMESVITVPNGTAYIADDAFADMSATEIILPDSLKQLSGKSLAGMDRLTKITMPFVGKSLGGQEAFGSVFGSGVPDKLVDVTVTQDTEVADNAFRNLSGIERISYRNSVEKVGRGAFYGCTALREGDFSHVKELGANAFADCVGLISLKLPFVGANADSGSGVADYIFGTNAEYAQYKLETLDLSSGSFYGVNEGAFRNMSGLKRIILPDSVSSVGASAFYNTGAEINLNDKITVVTARMFYGYSGSKLSLPETVTRIEREGFANAKSLSEIVLPASVNYIGERAFAGVNATIRFSGNALKRLGERSFADYRGRKLAIPSSVTEVNNLAFSGSYLEVINISAETELDEGVFENCVYLQEAKILCEVIPNRTFYGCESLVKVEIPNAKRIGDSAFYGCKRLSSVALPVGLVSLGNSVFARCTELGVVNFASVEPPAVGERAFPETQRIKIYVPAQSAEAYRELLEKQNNLEVIAN